MDLNQMNEPLKKAVEFMQRITIEKKHPAITVDHIHYGLLSVEDSLLDLFLTGEKIDKETYAKKVLNKIDKTL